MYPIYFPLVISRLNLLSLKIKETFLNFLFIQQYVLPVQLLPKKKWNHVPSIPYIIFHPLTTKILQLKYTLCLHRYEMNQNKPYITHLSD